MRLWSRMKWTQGALPLLVWAMVAAVMLAPPAQAAENTLLASLPLDLDGKVQQTAENATIRAAADADGVAPRIQMALDAVSARILVTNFTESETPAGAAPVPLPNPTGGQQGGTNDLTNGELETVEVRLNALRSDFLMVATDGAMAGATYQSGPLGGRAALDVGTMEEVVSYTDEPEALHFRQTLPEGTFSMQANAMHHEVRGDFTLVVHGAEVTALTPDRTYTHKTGTWTESQGEVGPLGVTTYRSTTTDYVTIQLTDAVMTLTVYGDEQAVHSTVNEVVLDVDGGIETHNAAGTLSVGNQSVRSAGDRLRAEGQFRLTPTYVVPGSDKSVVFAMDGNVSSLNVDGTTFAATEEVVAAVAAVTGSLLALGAVAYLWPTIKTGGAALVVPLYAKLTKDKVLDQETRNLVHAKIEQDPGCQVQQVAGALDISWTTAAYHIRVLNKMGLIVARKRGRHEHYFVAGSPASSHHGVMAALQNGTTKKIVELVMRNPGIIQKEVCDTLGIAPSTASGHLTKLRDIGAIEEQREWKMRRYFAGPALRGVPVEIAPGLTDPQGELETGVVA